MRLTILVLLALLNVKGCHLWAAPISTNGVILMWDYPTNLLSTNLVFKLYSSTNATAPLSTWALVKTIPGTVTATSFPMQPEARFFVMTASNFWGEANFSNVAATPAAPRSDVTLSIAPAP